MALKYKCLILDHDDTGVKSTPNIHYPSFVEALQDLRPNDEPITFEEFVRYCFNPGFSSLCTDIIKFTEEEQKHQQDVWKKYTASTVPDFYDLFAETILEFKKQGGLSLLFLILKEAELKETILFIVDLSLMQFSDGNYQNIKESHIPIRLKRF